jgi:competence protein ComEC
MTWTRFSARTIGPDSPDVETKTHGFGNRHRHWTGQFWTDDNIEILSPTPELVADCNAKGNWNDASYVFRISYGGRSVVLAGDAETAAWDSMLEGAKDKLSCDILKAAHHGRMSGHYADALEVMDPEYVICSVGNKQSVPDASPRYRDQGATVFSTRARGSITAKIWHDGEVWITDSDGNLIGELPALVAAKL